MQGFRYFESQGDDEIVELVIKRYLLGIFPEMVFSGIVYIIIILVFGIAPFFMPVLVQGFAYNIYILAWSLLMLFNTLFIFTVWSIHYLHVAILTNEHFVEINQHGVFNRDISVMPLDKLQDISASQDGFFPNMFNYGKIDLETAGELPNFILEYVHQPHQVAKQIIDVTEAYCERYGIKGDGINRNSNMVGTAEVKPPDPGE